MDRLFLVGTLKCVEVPAAFNGHEPDSTTQILHIVSFDNSILKSDDILERRSFLWEKKYAT